VCLQSQGSHIHWSQTHTRIEGIKRNDEKICAINDTPAPIDKKGVERLLGSVNCFIANLAAVAEPIRVLLKCQWSYEQDKELQEIKSSLTKDEGPVVRFFNCTNLLLSAVMLHQQAWVGY